MRRKRNRFIPFELRKQWGVLDRSTGELTEKAGRTERYPESWARTRADQLNKEQQDAIHKTQ